MMVVEQGSGANLDAELKHVCSVDAVSFTSNLFPVQKPKGHTHVAHTCGSNAFKCCNPID